MSPAPGAIGRLSAAEKRALLGELLDRRRVRQPAIPERKVRPVSFSQRRLWFLDQLAPGTSLYNVDCMLPLPDRGIDEAAFERAVTEIVRRHESLRTVFEAVDGEPMQSIQPPSRVNMERVDLRHLSQAEQNVETLRLANTMASRPFDLAAGPLMRIALVHRTDGQIMILIMHHIICDGWSMGVFFQEFVEIYGAYITGRESPLPELTIQYSDFAAWQRQWLQGEGLEELLNYWKAKLDGIPVLNLPCDYNRPPVQTFRGASRKIRISKSVVEALKAVGEGGGATLFMVLLTAFKVLLSRYAGQDDIAVGSYIANRNRAEVEQLIGFFVNTLVMRTDLSGNPPFREAMARVKETALGAYAHQDMPFETLVEVLQPDRDLSRNPLFQVIFQLFNAPNVEMGSEESHGNAPKVEKRSSTFDFGFNAWETPEGLRGAIEYSTDLFEPETIERMACHYSNLLDGIIRDPWTPIQQLPLISEAELHRALVEWNATAGAPDIGFSIEDRFRACVERHPEKVALIASEEGVTYRELAARTGEVARRLKSGGVGPGCLIGICLERSVAAVVAMLAVFETGAAYVPMDPSHPASRREYIERDAGVYGVIEASGFRVSPREPARHEGLAYVIYTSGSTGLPKGVAVEHRQISNRLRWMWREYPFAPDEVGCLKTSLTFVDSIWEVLGPLLHGVPTVVVDELTGHDPRELLRMLADRRVTRLWLVPALLREMVQLLELEVELRQSLSALRFWVSSGEALSPQLASKFARLMPEATLYNLYGTSEVWDATWHDPRRDKTWPGRSCIGRPIDGVEAWVLDRTNCPSPVGVPGELVIGGAGLARGYLNQPDLTNQKFVPHPFQGAGLVFRTGDATRYLPDGQIEYLGRLDRQVKIRGFRVEPGEIEDIVMQHDGILEAAVIPIDGPAGLELAAYVVLAPNNEVSALELTNYIGSRLPSQMAPATWTFLAEIPRTTSGKVNRLALPTAERSVSGWARQFLAPRTPVEETAVRLYEEIFGLETVSADAHFFRELGGHSLLVTRLASRIRNRVGVEIPLQALFESPTPELLAQLLEAYRSPDASGAE
jgi:amino acid adenylation domain-containing protein